MKTSQRLVSLDVLRGITVAGMVLVNNAGGRESYTALRHSAWNGLTPCDLVFPFFLFIVGVSTYLSLSKFDFHPSAQLLRKVVRRTLLILLLGWAIGAFELLLDGDVQPWLHLRLPGVLQRIALCYGAVSLLALYTPHRMLKMGVGVLLVGYAVLLHVGNGYAQDAGNILSVVDHRLLGAAHLYKKSPIDPEGLLSTLPAIAHTLIGFLCARLMRKHDDVKDKVIEVFLSGFVLWAAGWLLSDALPFNKRIWSPTYTLATSGAAMLLWAWLIVHLDVHHAGRWTRPFVIIGMNPLALYVLSEVLAAILNRTGVKAVVYLCMQGLVPDACLASALYALLYTFLIGGIGYVMYRRGIFIKI
jgi:predicted acyltransferase